MTPTPRTHRHGRHTQRQTVAAVQAAAPMLNQLEALYRLAQDWSPGYGTAGDGTGRASTPDGSPPPPGTWQPRPHDDLERICAAIRVACDELVRVGVDLLHRSTDTGRRTTTAICAGCERTVANTETDRLRSGLCNSCYAQTRRIAAEHPDLDRGDVLLLWAKEQRLSIVEEAR